MYDHLMSTSIFTFIMKKDVHLSSEHYGANGYKYNLDLLIISHQLRVLYHACSECREKNIQTTSTYLTTLVFSIGLGMVSSNYVTKTNNKDFHLKL